MKESLTVAVLMGGPSGEHDVSLKSGHGVVDALTHRGWSAEPIVIPRDVSVADACALTARALQQGHPDVAFIALHGAFGEDGTIQHVCEDLHLAYTGSDVSASRLGMDKIASRKRFEVAGLLVPRWQVVDLSAETPGRSTPVTYPVVVKPANQGSSLGVSIVQRERELSDAFASAGRYGPLVLMEEFVAGREVTVGVLGEEPLPIVEIRPRQPFFDYTAKYTLGATTYIVPAPLPTATIRSVQAMGLAAHRALGCRHFSRADIILNREYAPVLLEVNTIPGFTPTSLLPKAAACLGISYESLCEQLVLMAWQDAHRLAHTHA